MKISYIPYLTGVVKSLYAGIPVTPDNLFGNRQERLIKHSSEALCDYKKDKVQNN